MLINRFIHIISLYYILFSEAERPYLVYLLCISVPDTCLNKIMPEETFIENKVIVPIHIICSALS